MVALECLGKRSLHCSDKEDCRCCTRAGEQFYVAMYHSQWSRYVPASCRRRYLSLLGSHCVHFGLRVESDIIFCGLLHSSTRMRLWSTGLEVISLVTRLCPHYKRYVKFIVFPFHAAQYLSLVLSVLMSSVALGWRFWRMERYFLPCLYAPNEL